MNADTGGMDYGLSPSGCPGMTVTLLPAVDLPAHQRDRLLIDFRGVPGLDRGKVRLTGLVAGAGAPAMGFEEIRGRGQGARGRLEIADTVGRDVLGQELG